MSRHKEIVLPAILLTVFAAVIVFFVRARSHPQPPTPPAKGQQQGQLVLKWESSPIVALTEPVSAVKAVIEGYPIDYCPQHFGDSNVPVDQLSTAQREDLYNAVVTLLQCYEKSSANSLISYMQGRSEQFAPAVMQAAKETYAKQQRITQDELKSISDKDLFAKVWQMEKCRSFWSAIIKADGFICVWRAKNVQRTRNQPIGKYVTEVFMNTTNYTHFFEPSSSLEEACKGPEGALISDVMVVIKHTKELKEDRSPYYIRFWYSEKDHLWHPFFLKHVSTHYGASGPKVELLF